MKVGIRLPQTGKHVKPEKVIDLAEAADRSDSVWIMERLLWPISPHIIITLKGRISEETTEHKSIYSPFF